jgi:subtilisin family serine protease
LRNRPEPPSGGRFGRGGARAWLVLPFLAAIAVVAFVVVLVTLDDDGREAGPPPTTTTPEAPTGTSLRTVFTAPRHAAPRRGRPANPRGAGVGAPGAGKIEYVPGGLIVKFVDGTSPDVARRVLERVDADLEARVDPLDVRVVEVAPAETRDALATVAASPAVEYVERDVALQSFATIPNDTLWNEQWGPLIVDAPSAWDIARGSPKTIVAVLDTGVDGTHPDLQASLVTGYDFVNGDPDPADDEGHGTAVAGVIAARTNNDTGQAGICWHCSLMPIKVLDASGSGNTSDVAAGIVWAVDHGARVISMSLGGPGSTQTLADAVAYAIGKGAVVVAAAGNDGSSELNYPAAFEGVIGVAGTTHTGELYSWSNFGPWVQMAAPGCNVATYLNGEYVNFCGTSSATPIVAGVAGLLFSARPSATGRQVEDALVHSVVELGSGVRYGRVSAQRTLEALAAQPHRATPAPASTPRPTPSASSTPARATIRGKLTAGAPVRLNARLPSGRATATLTVPGTRGLSLMLVDSRGVEIARASGRSPLRLSRIVAAGRYRFVVRGSTRAPFTLRIASGS